MFASSLIHLVFFYLLPEKCSRLCVYHCPLPHSHLEGHLSAFHSGAITVKTALHICGQLFHVKISLHFSGSGINAQVQVLGHMKSPFLV